MPTSQLDGFLRRLRAVTLHDAGGVTDGQLLESFITRKDEAAFVALVRRHGPMVWGVCRRVLGQVHDAEDAFQATFLVLVRKATAVLPRAMVGNWLHGVAYRTAMKARATSIKRRAKEKQVELMPEPPTAQHDFQRDLLLRLDQELDRLPDKYRAAVVLCDLQGKTHKEAARQLGWPVGTLSTRLVRARAILAKRLARHGLAVSGGALGMTLSGTHNASASVPASVVYSTIKAATLVAAGKATAGLISVNVAALTEGVLKTMLLKKLKIATLVLVGVAALSGAGGLLYQTEVADQPKAQSATDKANSSQSPSVTDEPVLARGMRAVAVKLSKNQKIPDGVLPGMAVDVIAEISEPIRTGIALDNVKLLAIDVKRAGDQTVTVQVTPTQAQVLILAQEEGTTLRIKPHVMAEVQRLRKDNGELTKRSQPQLPEAQASNTKLVIKVYPVAGLTDTGAQVKWGQQAQSLVRVITRTIEPASWDEQAGPGSIDYLQQLDSLIVLQSPEVHKQVQELLDVLRETKRDQEKEGEKRKK